MLRERLSVVTQAWFAQRDFADIEILRRFQESLADEQARGTIKADNDRDEYLGMSLRELIHNFKWQTLVLLKCCLLQPKVRPGPRLAADGEADPAQMLFFGSRCDRLCMVQFSLISLIPGLLRSLQDCADPELDNNEKKLSRPTSLQSSNRSSLLSFMGLPLQIFGKVRTAAAPSFPRPMANSAAGQLLWPLHSPAAARYSGRLRHKVIPGREHKLSPTPAERPLQRHTHQPGRGHRHHHIALSEIGPRPNRG